MPTGHTLPSAVRDEVMQRLAAGELPRFVAPEYGITRKTCQHYLRLLRAAARARFAAEGCSKKEIELKISNQFRGEDCLIWTIELPDRMWKEDFVIHGGIAGEG